MNVDEGLVQSAAVTVHHFNLNPQQVVLSEKPHVEDTKKDFQQPEGHVCCIMNSLEADVMRIFHLGGCFHGSDTV